MTRPGEHDIRKRDRGEQITRWEASQREGHNAWAYAPIDEVGANLASTGYPEESPGSFEGARRAVDEYLAENRIGIFLNRVDATGRLANKIE
jgi:hypothetical protein